MLRKNQECGILAEIWKLFCRLGLSHLSHSVSVQSRSLHSCVLIFKIYVGMKMNSWTRSYIYGYYPLSHFNLTSRQQSHRSHFCCRNQSTGSWIIEILRCIFQVLDNFWLWQLLMGLFMRFIVPLKSFVLGIASPPLNIKVFWHTCLFFLTSLWREKSHFVKWFQSVQYLTEPIRGLSFSWAAVGLVWWVAAWFIPHISLNCVEPLSGHCPLSCDRNHNL